MRSLGAARSLSVGQLSCRGVAACQRSAAALAGAPVPRPPPRPASADLPGSGALPPPGRHQGGGGGGRLHGRRQLLWPGPGPHPLPGALPGRRQQGAGAAVWPPAKRAGLASPLALLAEALLPLPARCCQGLHTRLAARPPAAQIKGGQYQRHTTPAWCTADGKVRSGWARAAARQSAGAAAISAAGMASRCGCEEPRCTRPDHPPACAHPSQAHPPTPTHLPAAPRPTLTA